MFTPNTDDGLTSPIYIGFNFNYYCTTYSTVLIYTNGMIQFDIGAPSTFPLGYDIAQTFGSSTSAPNGLVAFRMDDLDPGVGGTITYTTLGTSPNMTFVVTYSNVPIFGQATQLESGQIVLYQTSNIIDIITINSTQSANLATQGIENALGNLGVGVPGRNNAFWGGTNSAYRFEPVGPAPLTALNGTTSICQGLTTTYTLAPASGALSYNWSLPAGWLGSSTLTSISPTVGTSGLVSVNATFTCGISAPITLSVTVIPAPVVAITSATPAIFCSGPTVTIQTSGAATYTLQPGNLIGVPPFFQTPLVSTVYTVTGINASGCLSNNLATAIITVKETPTVTINSGAICIGQSFQLSPNGANSYVYSSTFSSPTPSTVGTHTYSVVGTATNGCISNTAISTVTVNALPTLSIVATRTAICNKQTTTLTASGASTYTWVLSTPNASNAVITVSPNTTTQYVVNGTDINGCANSQTMSISVSGCVGIAEQSNATTWSVYPNPSKGEFIVQVSENSKMIMYDAIGRVVLSYDLSAGENAIAAKTLPSGNYLIRIQSGNASEIRKIIIE
jgi:hypothetical protein